MLLFMRRELAIVESAMEIAEINDKTETHEYKELKYRQKLVKRIIRRLESAEKNHDVNSKYIRRI